MALPSLLRGVTPRVEGRRTSFQTALGSAPATFSLPKRPRAWILAVGDSHPELERTDCAIVRLDVPGELAEGALCVAAAELHSRPETRGLPVFLAGSGPSAGAAMRAAADVPGRFAGLILDRLPEGPICLTPTHLGAGIGLTEFLDTELPDSLTPGLDRRRRRSLARGISRQLRRDYRSRGIAGVSVRARAGLAGLATAVAFTLSLGFGAPAAEAAWTASYDGGNGLVSFNSSSSSDQLTLDCDTVPATPELEYFTGGGPQHIGNPFFPFGNLPCASALDLTVAGNNGNDTIDLSAVVPTEYVQLGTADITVGGGANEDSIEGPQGIDKNSLTGDAGSDTIVAGSGTDLISGGDGNDSLVGGGLNDTVDYSLSGTGIDLDLGAGTATGQGTDTLSAIESAIGTNVGDTLDAGSFATSLIGSGGDDSLTGASLGTSTLQGGIGNDTLLTGFQADSLDGGGGNDDLNGGTGADVMIGGANDDTMQGGDTANDSIDGGTGSDLASFNQGAGPADIDLSSSGSDTVTGVGTDTLAGIEAAIGTDAADTMVGGTEDNTLLGEQGSDTINGGNGNDSLDGQDGDDIVDGDAGANTLAGGGENDVLSSGSATAAESLDGGPGADTLTSSANSSTLAGNDGDDSLIGSLGAFGERFDGGNNNDTISANPGADTVLGGAGNDSIEAGAGADTVDGGGNNDTIDGDGGFTPESDNDTLVGGTGTDRLIGIRSAGATTFVLTTTQLTGEGADSVSGFETASLSTGTGADSIDANSFAGQTTIATGDAADTIRGSGGSDSLVAGTGSDRLIQSGNSSQTLSDGQATGFGTDTLSGFLTASLSGGGSANSIDATNFSGSVTIDGAAGDDTLTGSTAAADSLFGGTGTNRLLFAAPNSFTLTDSSLSAVTVGTDTLSSFQQASISGSAALDASAFSGTVTLTGSAGNDTLQGAAGSDLLDGAGGTGDRVLQTSNADQIASTVALGGDGGDVLAGIERLSLTGGAADNTISAVAFNPASGGEVTIAGGGGADTITGTDVNDNLAGDAGLDRLIKADDTTHTLTDTTALAGDTDTISGFNDASISGGGAANLIDVSAFGGQVTVDGQGANDTLIGSAQADSLIGGTGTGDRIVEANNFDQDLSDTLLALAGAPDDSLSGIEQASISGGGAGNAIDAGPFTGQVTIAGLSGNDTIEGGSSGDSLVGGGDPVDRVLNEADSNMSFGAGGGQLITVGEGTDTILGFAEVSLTGGAGPNVLDGSGDGGAFNQVYLDGGGMADTLTGGGSPDSIFGGGGNDLVPGAGGGADVVDGGGENDTLVVDANDTALGGAGNDRFDATSNDPASIEGGTGTDRILNTGTNQILSNSELSFTLPTDTIPLSSIEEASLVGTTNNDVMNAGAFTGVVTLDGGGGGGANTLLGTANSDSLVGAGGTDRINQIR